MSANTPLIRQYKGCGYLPRLEDRTRLTLWQPPRGGRAYHGPDLTACAGYTCNLPETIEASIARAHWKTGNAIAACDGEAPTEDLLNSILILDAAYSECESWLMTPSKDGGGGS